MKTLTLKRNLSESPVTGKIYDGEKFLSRAVDSGLEAGDYDLEYSYDDRTKSFGWSISGGAHDGEPITTPLEYVAAGQGVAVLQDLYIDEESRKIDVLKSRSNLLTVRAALRGLTSATLTVEDIGAATGGGTGSPDTALQVKNKYESNTDTNAYTDAEKSKLGLISLTGAKDLDTIEDGAEVNPTDAEIVSAIDAALGGNGWQGSGGPIGSSIASQQIAFATGTDTVGGTGDFTWDGTNMTLKGPSADRFIRFVESTGQYNGGFIQFDGADNKMRLGVHPTGDADTANDINSITLLRSNGRVGIFNDDPAFELDVTGTIHSDGARIAPTFSNFEGRVAVGGLPSFGGTRLGDSDLQTESIDVKQIYIKGDNQQTKAAIFINDSGSVISIKGFDDGIQVVDFTSKDVPVTESAESTIANSIRYDNGHQYINDQGVQNYVTAGSEVAQTFFQILQTRGGANRLPFYFGHYDGTSYEKFYGIDTDTGVMEFENPPTAPDAVLPNELATYGQMNLGGTTAERPFAPMDYLHYFDTDLGYLIAFNGTDWVSGNGTVV